MNLQQLAVFREVMETGSVSAAARNLGRTQPAISASLKALEANLGMELFEREGRKLVPVPEAHYLLSEAAEILTRVTATEMNLVGMRNRSKGSLRIVAMPGPSVYLLPDFVSRIKSGADDLRPPGRLQALAGLSHSGGGRLLAGLDLLGHDLPEAADGGGGELHAGLVSRLQTRPSASSSGVPWTTTMRPSSSIVSPASGSATSLDRRSSTVVLLASRRRGRLARAATCR